MHEINFDRILKNGVMKYCRSCKRLLAFPLVFMIAAFMASGCQEALETARIKPPLKFEVRESLVKGSVLQVTNMDAKPLEIQVYVLDSSRTTRSTGYSCVLKSGEKKEVGFFQLGGWTIEDGEKIIVKTEGYAADMQILPHGETFSYGFYSDDD